MIDQKNIIELDELVLVTGATGFVGVAMLRRMLELGFRNIRCLVRPSSNPQVIETIAARFQATARVEVIRGNLLSAADCAQATSDASVIYHLAVGAGGRSFPDAYMNAVVTTRNLIEAALHHGRLKRFVNVSSFALYSNRNKPNGRTLDESSPLEEVPQSRDAYCFAKLKQDELVVEYGRKSGLNYVILRPGVVYGPGKAAITGRVGIGTFGIFLHLGGFNRIPFTYVDNCADAIIAAGLKSGVDGEVFNVVDDDLPSSRTFLRQYKRRGRSFKSIYLPGVLSYLLCLAVEKLSTWSGGQLPAFLNRRIWHAHWKRSAYTNQKLKDRLHWRPAVSTPDGMQRYFDYCRSGGLDV